MPSYKISIIGLFVSTCVCHALVSYRAKTTDYVCKSKLIFTKYSQGTLVSSVRYGTKIFTERTSFGAYMS